MKSEKNLLLIDIDTVFLFLSAGSTVVSDDELDEMLESGQTEVFISNVSIGILGPLKGGKGSKQGDSSTSPFSCSS